MALINLATAAANGNSDPIDITPRQWHIIEIGGGWEGATIKLERLSPDGGSWHTFRMAGSEVQFSENGRHELLFKTRAKKVRLVTADATEATALTAEIVRDR